jgi:hypothetical protein
LPENRNLVYKWPPVDIIGYVNVAHSIGSETLFKITGTCGQDPMVPLIALPSFFLTSIFFHVHNILQLSMYLCMTSQGLAVIFSHRQIYVKREGRTLFLLPKVKVEFRQLFSLQKRFSLCSYHNINANIVVFCWLTGLQWNNTCFLIPSGLDNFLSYSFPVYTDLIILIEIKKSKYNFKK